MTTTEEEGEVEGVGSAGEGNLVVELEEVGVATTTLTPAMVRIHHRMVFKVLKDKQALPQQMVRCLSPSKTQLLSNIQAQVTKEDRKSVV